MFDEAGRLMRDHFWGQWPCLRTVSSVVAPDVPQVEGLSGTLTQGH
jgi:hypothetical protein